VVTQKRSNLICLFVYNSSFFFFFFFFLLLIFNGSACELLFNCLVQLGFFGLDLLGQIGQIYSVYSH
jgi:hypothetical protein